MEHGIDCNCEECCKIKEFLKTKSESGEIYISGTEEDKQKIVDYKVKNYWKHKAYSIESWVVPIECDKLFELAKQSKIGIIEVGSWLGRSSIVLAEGSRQGNQVDVHCIDKWEDFIPPENVGNVEEQFLENTKDYRRNEILYSHKMESHKIAKDFGYNADLVFIDANHEYESVKQDISDWLKYCKGNWAMCFHDYCTQPWLGVTKAVNEYFKDFEVVRSLAICKKENLKLVGGFR